MKPLPLFSKFCSFSLIICKLIFSTHITIAQENNINTLYVNQPNLVIATAPGGNKVGEVNINTPVKINEKNGSWVKITIEGWVRESGLSESLSGSGLVNESGIKFDISGYKVERKTERLPKARVYLTMTIKNITKEKINSWEGILVAQLTSSPTVLFRQIISDTKPVSPNQEQQVVFYWEEGEDPYEHLITARPETVKLELYKVKAN